jgi:hypothetical protein
MTAEFDAKPLLKAYKFNLAYAEKLVSDIPEEQMYKSFGSGLENYPAFALGHLAIASALIAENLGDPYVVPDGWNRFFRRKGPGDPRLPPPRGGGMPSKEHLLSELKNKHGRVDRIIGYLPEGSLNKPIKWRFDDYFPSTGDYLTFMCITHEAMHLGQLAAWRRAAGLPSALAGM